MGAILLALAASAFWLQRVAFTPSTDGGLAVTVMDDEAIRNEVATLVASSDADTLGMSSTDLRAFVLPVADIDAGAALMAGIVRDAHAKIIGDRAEPVRISPADQVVIVRSELVAVRPPITLPVQEVGAISAIDSISWWLAVVSAALGVVAVLAGIVLRPEHGEPALALGGGLAALAVLFPLLGWVVPAALLPALSDDTWVGVFPALAAESRLITFGVAIGALVLAVVVVATTSGARQRRQFSTPLAVGRYREQQRWTP